MKTDVLDQTGKKLDQVELNPTIFNASINPSLVAQSIRVRLINARTGTANTKTRAEVRGGGRKPWRQKGTGRARHGSTRSPIWTGGGTVFGPRAHKPSATMPTAMRRSALFSSLSDKLQNQGLIIIDTISLKQPKTQLVNKIFQALDINSSALIVVPAKDETLVKATRNLPNIKVMVAPTLHPYEILKYKTVIILKDSLSVMEDTFITKSNNASKSKSGKAEDVATSQPEKKADSSTKADAAKTTKKAASPAKKSAPASKAKTEK